MHLSSYPESTCDKARLKCSAHIASFLYLPLEPTLQTVCHEHLSCLMAWTRRRTLTSSSPLAFKSDRIGLPPQICVSILFLFCTMESPVESNCGNLCYNSDDIILARFYQRWHFLAHQRYPFTHLMASFSINGLHF